MAIEDLSPNEKYRIQILLEEYRALRGEIVQSMQNRNSVLTFGSAVLGAMTSATALSARNLNELTIFLIFTIAIPFVSLCTLNFWIAETSRIVRAGLYIRDHIETYVNHQVGDTLLWESFVRLPVDDECLAKMNYHDIVVDDVDQVFYLFSGIAIISFIGVVFYVGLTASPQDFKQSFAITALILGLLNGYLFHRTYMKRARCLIKRLRPEFMRRVRGKG